MPSTCPNGAETGEILGAPGYHPGRPRISSKERQRVLRPEWLLMRSLTVVLVLVVLALAGLFCLFIALYG